jgi:aspartyl-tRNA(Asn)/glutamyl-tRNA(Gln) amidotransferase subunit C
MDSIAPGAVRRPIGADTVRHVARLARLSLTDAEAAAFSPQLNAVFEHFERLAEADIGAVPPFHELGLEGRELRLRADEVAAPLQRETFLALAPRRDGAYLSVTAVAGIARLRSTAEPAPGPPRQSVELSHVQST